MSKTTFFLLIVIGLFFAFGGGYFLGRYNYEDNNPTRDVEHPKPKTIKDDVIRPPHSSSDGSQVEDKKSGHDTENQPEAMADNSVAQIVDNFSTVAEDESNEWDEEESDESSDDYVLRAQIEDFIDLHRFDEDITLRFSQCGHKQCQIIGTYGISNRDFDDFLNEMRQQDWWNFSGTSSHLNEENGIGNFVVTFKKRQNTN